MRQLERHCMIHAWSYSSPACYGGSEFLLSFPVYALKHPGGVASMTRDRGYPDWLVLCARLLAQPSCGQVTIVQNRCLIVFPCGYVKILQPVAICTVIFVTHLSLRLSPDSPLPGPYRDLDHPREHNHSTYPFNCLLIFTHPKTIGERTGDWTSHLAKVVLPGPFPGTLDQISI